MTSMRETLTAAFVILVASALVVAVDVADLSQIALIQLVTVMIGLTLLILSGVRRHYFASILPKVGRWVMLFMGTTLIQLIVVSLGDIQSPFLILIHLTTLGLSLIFTFTVSAIFMMATVGVLGFHIYSGGGMELLFLGDPVSLILYGLSFATVLPLSQAVSQRYHLKDQFAKILANEVQVGQAILADVQEMVFVTDSKSIVLSANDAAERQLHLAKNDLLDRSLFEVLYIKDRQGHRVSASQFAFDPQHRDQPPIEMTNVQLMSSGQVGTRQVVIRAKPIYDLEGSDYQVSYLIADAHAAISAQEAGSLEPSQLRYEALASDLRHRLKLVNQPDLSIRLMIASSIEQDIFLARSLEHDQVHPKPALVDIAYLARQVMKSQEEFALAFHSQLAFALPDFTQADIAPMVTPTFTVSRDDLTGPFFTTQTDGRLYSLMTQKLIQVALMLGAAEAQPQVVVQVTRDDTQSLILSIAAPYKSGDLTNPAELFVAYYGGLLTRTNLVFGSGLEGFLAMELSHKLGYRVWTTLVDNPNRVLFHVAIPRTQPANPSS
jgi:PAS domain-containing protein